MRRIVGLCVFCSLLGGTPLWAQTVGGPWPPRVQAILDELARQHPTWVADDTGGPENTPRYRLNKMVAEQVVCDLGPQYGLKRAGQGRPISSEVVAFNNGAVFLGWEWENSHDGRWEQFPGAIDLAGQMFVPVACVNHLTASPPPPMPTPGTPVPIPGTPTLDLSHLATKEDLAQLRQELAAVKEDTQEIRAGMNRVLKFTSKYILPVLGAVAAGWYMKPNEEPVK